MAATVFDTEARAVRQFIADIPGLARSGERTLAERAGMALDDYAARLTRARVPPRAVTPARYALAVLIDQAARAERRLRPSAWMAAAHVHLFHQREITADTILRFRDTARTEGGDYAELATFLAGVATEIEGGRQSRGAVSRLPALGFAFGTLALMLALAGYAGFLDYRYHAGILRDFRAAVAALPSEVGDRLDRLAELSAQVGRASDAAPLAELVTIPLWTSGPAAAQTYRAAVAEALPGTIRDAIGEAFATEGEDLELYDSLRAWSVLTGRSDWSPAFLAGWLESRDAKLGTGRLAAHVAALEGPSPALPAPDEALMTQAETFARGAAEEQRAFLELTRLDAVRALPAWDPAAAVPGIADVLVRRSGRPLADRPRLFTEAGWRYATEAGIGIAVQTARAEAARLFAGRAPSRNDSPDLVAEALQNATLRYWKTWLADLRVRPFADRDSAIRISGALAQRNSPLEALIGEVWTQIGGRDRLRPYPLQLRIASEFGPAIQYVEQGKVQELGALFAALNVALGAIEFDEDEGAEKLMNVQERARSVSALQAAPVLVAQIAEDVFAQTSAAHASLLANPLTREWQARVYPLCQGVAALYPFGEGGDADLADLAALLGPQGALPRFVADYAARYLDTSGESWRWKPEARLSGVGQDSAKFLQDASAIGRAYFTPAGEFGRAFDIAALAERGEATVMLGGTGTTVAASGQDHRLAWPGPNPDQGAEVAFRLGADTARVIEPGPWGFMRILDRTRTRPREQGRRHLVDLRIEGGRLFFEIAFDEPLNPVTVRPLARGLKCPPVL